MKRSQLAKSYRMPITVFRSEVTKLLYRVDEGEAFVVTRRAASAKGWSDEDIALLVPLNTTARDFEHIQAQVRADGEELRAEAEKARQADVVEDDAEPVERARSGVRVVGHVGEAKRGRRQQG